MTSMNDFLGSRLWVLMLWADRATRMSCGVNWGVSRGGRRPLRPGNPLRNRRAHRHLQRVAPVTRRAPRLRQGRRLRRTRHLRQAPHPRPRRPVPLLRAPPRRRRHPQSPRLPQERANRHQRRPLRHPQGTHRGTRVCCTAPPAHEATQSSTPKTPPDPHRSPHPQPAPELAYPVPSGFSTFRPHEVTRTNKEEQPSRSGGRTCTPETHRRRPGTRFRTPRRRRWDFRLSGYAFCSVAHGGGGGI